MYQILLNGYISCYISFNAIYYAYFQIVELNITQNMFLRLNCQIYGCYVGLIIANYNTVLLVDDNSERR
jgi:hypothetical protein